VLQLWLLYKNLKGLRCFRRAVKSVSKDKKSLFVNQKENWYNKLLFLLMAFPPLVNCEKQFSPDDTPSAGGQL